MTRSERADIRRRWTLSAIKGANEEAGHFFFSRDTMRFFGDTMRSFAVDVDGDGSIFVRRTRPRRDLSGRDMGGVSHRWPFDPATGHIGARERSADV